MFRVSVLISDVCVDEVFPQILAALADLARRDLRQLQQRHVGGAHIATRCSRLAVVEAGHVASDNLDNSGLCSQIRARYRIYGSSSPAMASIS